MPARSAGRHRRYAMRAVVLQEYGGPEKLKFEDNVPEPQISGRTVLIAAAAASVNPIDWKVRSGIRQKDSRRTVSGSLREGVSPMPLKRQKTANGKCRAKTKAG